MNPIYERKFSAGLVIGCAGKSKPLIEQTYFGDMRTRSGAELKYVINDAKKIYKKWIIHSNLPKHGNIYLENPTKKEVIVKLNEIDKILSYYDQGETGLYLYFAGHGQYGNGALVLKDDSFSAEELIHYISKNLDAKKGDRGIRIMLDSCYSGSFLIDIILNTENKKCPIRLLDAKVSSMPNEKSWELSFLEHGAYTFSLLYSGNQYVKHNELAKAIEENNHPLIAKYLQGMVGLIASPVSFLTQGKQHSIECLKGYHFSVEGYGSFSTTDYKIGSLNRKIMINLFNKAKDSIWES